AVPPQQPRRRGPNIGLIIGLILLVLLIVGGGIFFFASSRGSNTTTTITPTPTTNTTTPTPTPVPTPQALFTDTFDSNSQGWSTASQTGYSITIENGMLNMSEANHKLLRVCLPTQKD